MPRGRREKEEDGDEAGPGPGSSQQQQQQQDTRRSLLPKSWQRLQDQVTGRKDVPLPNSGANVTLKDLAR